MAHRVSWPVSAFWDYSISLYRRPRVQAVCLDLQRRHGLDVNLLLFACWLSSRGVKIDQATLARAQDAVAAWQAEVVRPLRALRRRLAAQISHAENGSLLARWPDLATALRSNVLSLELDGEHLAQLALTDVGADLKPTENPGVELAVLNLASFWPFRAEDAHNLQPLLEQAFPEAKDGQVTEALKSFPA